MFLRTCYHDLQLSQRRVCWISQEDVDISHHALLLLHTGVSPLLLVQNYERALWKGNIKTHKHNENAFLGIAFLSCLLTAPHCRHLHSSSSACRTPDPGSAALKRSAAAAPETSSTHDTWMKLNSLIKTPRKYEITKTAGYYDQTKLLRNWNICCNNKK